MSYLEKESGQKYNNFGQCHISRKKAGRSITILDNVISGERKQAEV